jgi:hypothetical protein
MVLAFAVSAAATDVIGRDKLARPSFPEQLPGPPRSIKIARMFSHIVIFWTDPAQPNAVAELLAGANKYLKNIPGVVHFHAGQMSASPRPVVDQSYQVALNLIFPGKAEEQAYQVHPQHLEFVEKVFKRTCRKVVAYDFE